MRDDGLDALRSATRFVYSTISFYFFFLLKNDENFTHFVSIYLWGHFDSKRRIHSFDIYLQQTILSGRIAAAAAVVISMFK